MSQVILDTGPCLNFFSIREGDLLHTVLSSDGFALRLPEEVADEIHHKSFESPFFAPAVRVFDGMRRAGKLEVIASDLETDEELIAAVKKVSDKRPSEFLHRRAKDRGETLVIAHAIKLRAAGHTVRLMIDEKPGRRKAAQFGFDVISTTRVLATAASMNLKTMAEMEALYLRLRPADMSKRPMDHGLPPWASSGLNNPRLYSSSAA